MSSFDQISRRQLLVGLGGGAFAAAVPLRARGLEFGGFAKGVAEAIGGDPALSAFYRTRSFDGIWAVPEGRGRVEALMSALLQAPNHGAPTAKFDPRGVLALLQDAQTLEAQGQAEVALSKLYLSFAQGLHGGFWTPNIPHIKRRGPQIDALALLERAARGEVLAALKASMLEEGGYHGLMAARARFEAQDWGAEVQGGKFELGETGARVVTLRDRLMAQGYLAPTLTRSYDEAMRSGVRAFQVAHGLQPDGVAGPATLAEINRAPQERVAQILVALERSRWANHPEETGRKIWVNLTDFSAVIMDAGQEVFRTRSVIGSTDPDRQTPEFSDQMRFAVLNPSWTVPRSIVTKEYLPQLQRNPNAVSGIDVIDSRGRVVDRSAVNFSNYDARSFPFSMRQPPSPRNSLGLVKYMFPNQWNIYLHDTPSKDLFNRETRAFSHGCIRLADPFEFGHALFAPEMADPAASLRQSLATGRETRVNLQTPVPVHLDYRTAFLSANGQRVEFRRDIYERDAQIWRQMQAQGLEIGRA